MECVEGGGVVHVITRLREIHLRRNEMLSTTRYVDELSVD